MIVCISGVLSIIYCTFELWLLDRFGRVKPQIPLAVGCDLSLFVNDVLSQYYVASDERQASNENALRAMVAMNLCSPSGLPSVV